MNDYRCDSTAKLEALFREGERADPTADGWQLLKGYVRGGLPPDRKGLIAALHDQCVFTEAQVVAMNALAEQVAKQTGQRVYVIFTATRWHLLLFAIEIRDRNADEPRLRLWYDDSEPDGSYAHDQYIAHYDPDGTFKLDGLS